MKMIQTQLTFSVKRIVRTQEDVIANAISLGGSSIMVTDSYLSSIYYLWHASFRACSYRGQTSNEFSKWILGEHGSERWDCWFRWKHESSISIGGPEIEEEQEKTTGGEQKFQGG